MKTYMIVTNDEYELPVYTEVVGAKNVADILGITTETLRHALHRGFSKRYKYKAVVIKERQIEDMEQYMKEYCRKYDLTHDRTEYFKQWYRRKKEEVF